MKDDDDGNKDWEEKLIRERMGKDPEFKETYLKAAMEAKFGKRRLSNPYDNIVKMRKLVGCQHKWDRLLMERIG